MQHGLGDARRARREQDQGDVRGPAGDGAGRHRVASDRLGQLRRVGERRRLEFDDEGGIDLAEGRRNVRRAERVQHRRGHGADAPAGPGQDGGRQAVGDLPGHRGTAADTPGPQPAGDRGHQCVDLCGREPRGTVDDLAGVRTEEGVQGRNVPGAPGLPVAPGLFGHPGRSEAGRHGRAPYLDPGIVTPMSWRESAWISR